MFLHDWFFFSYSNTGRLVSTEGEERSDVNETADRVPRVERLVFWKTSGLSELP